MRVFFRARPPLDSLQAPWAYALADSILVSIAHWLPALRRTDMQRLDTPAMRPVLPGVATRPAPACALPTVVDVSEDTTMSHDEEAPPLKIRRHDEGPTAQLGLTAMPNAGARGLYLLRFGFGSEGPTHQLPSPDEHTY